MEREEALEIARRLYKNSLFLKKDKEAMVTLIPELRESEDERIRKEMLNYLYDVHDDDEERARWIAWLEKQGEQPQGKSALESAKEEKIDNQNCVKPVNNVEPKFKVKYAGSEYNVFETKDIAGVTFYGIEDEPNHIDYVQAENCERVGGYGIKEIGSPYPTKPAVFSEHNPAWSEEDRDYYDAIIAKLEVTQEDALLTDNQMEFLKSLKDRSLQQPQKK